MPTRFQPVMYAIIGIALLTYASLNTAEAAGDPAYGKVLFVECAGCHAVSSNKVGPKLCGLIGRRAGSIADFGYSEAMRNSGLTWDVKTLDEYLASPFEKVPETRMEYPGFSDPEDRFEMIEYLKVITDPSKCK